MPLGLQGENTEEEAGVTQGQGRLTMAYESRLCRWQVHEHWWDEHIPFPLGMTLVCQGTTLEGWQASLSTWLQQGTCPAVPLLGTNFSASAELTLKPTAPLRWNPPSKAFISPGSRTLSPLELWQHRHKVDF